MISGKPKTDPGKLKLDVIVNNETSKTTSAAGSTFTIHILLETI